MPCPLWQWMGGTVGEVGEGDGRRGESGNLDLVYMIKKKIVCSL